MKLYSLTFLSSILFGTSLAISSSSWAICWLGLEINLMGFIPVLLYPLSSNSSEASMKYFLAQALASLLIITTAVGLNKFFSLDTLLNVSNLLAVSLGIKAGMAPTHFWFPQVMQLTEWMQASILLTWQKIAPVLLISVNPSTWLLILIFGSALTGTTGGFNQNSVKKIITYSSIAHLAWLTSASILNEKIWWVYLISYIILTLTVVAPLYALNLKTINKMNSLPAKSSPKIIFFVSIFSLGGLPPFLGILPSVMVIITLTAGSLMNYVLALTLISTSLLTLFFYMRLLYSSLVVTNFLLFAKLAPLLMFNPASNFLISVALLGNLFLLPLVLMFS